jgi:hypothetical protein
MTPAREAGAEWAGSDPRLSRSVLGHLERGRPDLATKRCLLTLATFRGEMTPEKRRCWTWLAVMMAGCREWGGKP